MRLGGGALVVIVIASLIFGVNPLEMIGMLEGGAPPRRRRTPGQPPGYGPQRAPGPPPPRVANAAPGSEEGFRRGRSRRHRRRVASRVQDDGRALRGAATRAVPRRNAVGVRPRLGRRPARSTARPTASSTSTPAFFDELSRRFGAPGDFAQAYVIAHEVGHHVQNLTGTMKMVDQKMQGSDARGRNALSVRLELQADCYAGIWGFYRAEAKQARAGRPRGRLPRGRRRRRRLHPEACARLRRAGVVHARQRRAAAALVQDRAGVGGHPALQHLRVKASDLSAADDVASPPHGRADRLRRSDRRRRRRGARHRARAARRLRPPLRRVPRVRARGASGTSKRATGSPSSTSRGDRIDFYDRRVLETAGEDRARLSVRRSLRRRRRAPVGGGEAPLHRAPRRPQAAGVRGDVLQLRLGQDAAPRVLPQPLHLRAPRDLHRAHRRRSAVLSQLLPAAAGPAPRADRHRARPRVRAPVRGLRRRSAPRPGRVPPPLSAAVPPRGQPPDPGAVVAVLPQPDRVHRRARRQRRPRLSVRRAGQARRGRQALLRRAR